MLQEFKKFIARGNVFDMAVGIVMGAAFTAIVNSAVADLVMPVIGVITSGVDFGDKFFALNGESYTTLAAAKEAGAPVITYGVFVNAVINFFIVSFVIFMMIKQVNRLKKAEETAPAEPPADVRLLTEIRDLLKDKQ
ncbi:MAG: large conductance mechanosensitive channel protein MscL [Micavibrio aeruginosavorus]|uniref:Large-conductance mechanosensitive channel n=1 Tax=Micavibrio aeruginosavorus TaxID=349221 RepID=A0A2W5BXL2_9BACT|nr:MAG: large conductance mechanosensitive channel protein MscL [Micavibrio aeruginosavorus]